MTRLWAFGDSITFGTWLEDPAGQSWPGQLAARLDCVELRNLGVGGMAVAYADTASPERMDAYVLRMLNTAAELPDVVLFAGGLNDLIRALDPTPTREAIFTLGLNISARWPAIRFMPLTVTPYRSDEPAVDQLAARRQVLNGWLRAQYGTAGQLIDTGDLLTAGATYGDVRWFVDSKHPNADGAGIIAHGVQTVLAQRGITCR